MQINVNGTRSRTVYNLDLVRFSLVYTKDCERDQAISKTCTGQLLPKLLLDHEGEILQAGLLGILLIIIFTISTGPYSDTYRV